MGDSIPLACQDWADTKAAYRFFANEGALHRTDDVIR
nr:transposase DNA-binding-containing protein [Azospirillum brasilense]